MREDIMKTIKAVFILFTLISFFYPSTILAQDYDVYSQDSLWKEKQEYLNQFYIPKDEMDAFHVLEEISEAVGILKFKEMPEDTIKGRLTYGLGMWMMQNWSLYTGSRLSYYLNRRGLIATDDMVEYLIIAFHRYLNKVELQSQDLIDSLNLVHKKMHEEKLENAIKGDTLIYNKETGEVRKKN